MQPKSMFASKTFWINALVILGGVINEITPIVQDTTMSRGAIVYAILMIILRRVTKNPATFTKSP